MPQRNRKSEQIRRANRVIQSRSFILMLVMGVLLFVVLFFKLYQLQIGRHDELQKKAINQQVRSTVVTASRGTIYDASGNILAISSTAETVFLDPNAIDKALSDTEKPVAWTRELIAQRLGEILGISEDSILEKMERTYSQYEVLKLRVDEDVANEVRSFINEYSVKGIYLSPDAKRYYPYGTLASQVIGFVGTDNTGLYGLEAQYEDQLEGQTGLVVTARDNAGNDLLYEVRAVPRRPERQQPRPHARRHRAVLPRKGHRGDARPVRREKRRHRHRHERQDRRHPRHGILSEL